MRSHAKASTAGSRQRQCHSGHIARLALLILLCLLTVAPSALAAPSRSFEKSIATAGSQFTAGANPQALTVDQSNGDIYAINAAAGTVHRLDSTGTPKNFTAGPDNGTNTLTGFSFETGPSASQVALDNSPGPANGDIYVADSNNAVVKVFAGDGTPLATLSGSGTPDGAFSKPCGVAVDQSNGNIYIADFAQRIWRYTPSANPVTEANYSGAVATATEPGGIPTPFKPCQLAAHSGEVYAMEYRLADFFEITGPLYRYSASAFALGPPPTPPPPPVIDSAVSAVAIDPTNGEVYADRGGEIAVFPPSCTPSPCTPTYTFGSSADFGVNSAGIAVKGSNGPAYVSDRRAASRHIDVFAPAVEPVELSVKKAPSGSGVVTSAPAGIECGATCEADFAKDSGVTLTATADTGSKFKEWSGCDSVTLDGKCVVDMNAAREVTVTFAAKPTISGQTAKAHDTSARLEAGVEPETGLDPESEETTYRFQYVDQASFEAEGYLGAASAPVPAAKVPAGAEPVSVFTVVEGLSPNTTYHFRLIAFNSVGESAGPDQTFTTHTPPFVGLPGNRAYEQASPVAKNGLDASGTKETVRATPSGDGITYAANSGMPDGVGGQRLPTYLAKREAGKDGEKGNKDDEWVSRGLLPPNSEGQSAQVIGWTRDFSQVFNEAKRSEEPAAKKTLLERSTDGGPLTTIVPHLPLGESDFYFAGASADNSKVYFETDGPALTSGAIGGKDNLYLWNRVNKQVSLVGVLPDSACVTPPCVPPGGSFAGSYDWINGEKALGLGGAKRRYYTQDQHAISDSGERAFFTAGGTGEIYLRSNPAGPSPTTVEISASEKKDGGGPGGTDPAGTRPKTFMGATPDGSSAFFTSAEKLTDDADTGPEPDGFPAIARADIDGDPKEMGFLPASADGPGGVAIEGTHIYWADAGEGNPGEGTIGRAELDVDGSATDIEPNFIEGASNPNGIAVGEGFIYWTNAGDEEDGTGTIGRADINGTLASVDQECVTGAHNPQGIAVGGGFIYWANRGSTPTQRGVGRVESDCDGAEQAFIPGIDVNFPLGIAIDATHLYWSGSFVNGLGETVFSRISRAELDGDESILNFIALGPGGADPQGIALNGTHLFWAQPGTDSIGRANKSDGSEVSEEFITGADNPRGLALDGSHLYWAANQEVLPNAGNDLYRYDAEADGDGHHLTDVSLADGTVAPGTNPNGAEVRGVLGASGDGSRIYFAANGVLTSAPNARGESAVAGNCPERPSSTTGTCNLYLSDGGETSFIARLGGGDALNWIGTPEGILADTTERLARVSPDGATLLFSSRRQLSDYENEGRPRFYRYDDETREIGCVTCDPSGAPPTNAETKSVRTAVLLAQAPASTLSRWLSVDGKRVFFHSTDALVAADTNGDGGCPTVGSDLQGYSACQDVYMWEAEGSGSCEEDQQGGGCLYLLSTGKSPYPSFLADASASGDDVFFFTRDQLVGQDTDQLYDVYDARVNGGLASQNEAPPVPCEGEGCKPGASAPPGSTSAGSASFSGPGNPKAGKKPRPRCAKGKRRVRRGGKARCVKRQQRGKQQRNANTNRRAGR